MDYISGVEKEYIANPVDTAIGLWSKVVEFSKAKLYNLGDAAVVFVFEESIRVVDTEVSVLKIERVTVGGKKTKKLPVLASKNRHLEREHQEELDCFQQEKRRLEVTKAKRTKQLTMPLETSNAPIKNG